MTNPISISIAMTSEAKKKYAIQISTARLANKKLLHTFSGPSFVALRRRGKEREHRQKYIVYFGSAWDMPVPACACLCRL